MVSRIHFDDQDEAMRVAEAIDAAGHEVALVKERFAGEDDDEEVDHVVATPASREKLAGIIGDDVFVETD